MLHKTLTKYYLLTFFLFYGLLPNLFSQNNILNTKLSIRFQNIPIEKALEQIEQEINYSFTFDESILEKQENINFAVKNTSLKQCLDSIFKDTSLIYKQINNHIVIKRNNNYTFVEGKKIAANTQHSLHIRGQIIDQISKKAIPYTAIAVNQLGIGVISNLEGYFILKIPPTLKNKKLIISHIGYENLVLAIDTLYNKNTIFKLKPSFISIQEVIIRNTDAKYLLRTAIQNIDKNYSIKPVYLTSFYREGIKRKGEFMFFSEAVLNVFKSSYKNENAKDQIKVLKSRKMKNISEADTVVLKIKSGLKSVLHLDIVKNRTDFLLPENFKYYNYKMVDIVTYNNKACYAIDFEQKDFVVDALYTGTIYVEYKRLAIIGADFRVNPNKINHAQNNFVIKKTRGIKIKILDTHYLVSYRQIGNQYYLNYVKGEMQLKVRKRNKLFPVHFETSLEMALSDIDTLNVERFTRKEIENLNTIFSETQYDYDESYWENYNFIKPDDSWQEAIRKLQKKNNKPNF